MICTVWIWKLQISMKLKWSWKHYEGKQKFSWEWPQPGVSCDLWDLLSSLCVFWRTLPSLMMSRWCQRRSATVDLEGSCNVSVPEPWFTLSKGAPFFSSILRDGRDEDTEHWSMIITFQTFTFTFLHLHG